MPIEVEYSCPICDTKVHTRNFLRHIIHNHKLTLSNSMTAAEKEAMKTHKLPMLFGNRGGSRHLAICCECETGYHTFSRDKEVLHMSAEQYAERHKKCVKNFDKYAALFVAVDPVDLPRDIVREMPTKAAKPAGGAGEAPPPTEWPAPPPPSEEVEALKMEIVRLRGLLARAGIVV